jgi:histidine triad (HIT) family protein
MNACPFCEIISGKRNAKIIYKDDQVIAFRDIYPVAPSHVLIVPNNHISSLNDIKPSDEILLGHLFTVAHEVAKLEGIESSGYRLIINTGPDAGQTINHVHLHLIGGQPARYPMG